MSEQSVEDDEWTASREPPIRDPERAIDRPRTRAAVPDGKVARWRWVDGEILEADKVPLIRCVRRRGGAEDAKHVLKVRHSVGVAESRQSERARLAPETHAEDQATAREIGQGPDKLSRDHRGPYRGERGRPHGDVAARSDRRQRDERIDEVSLTPLEPEPTEPELVADPGAVEPQVAQSRPDVEQALARGCSSEMGKQQADSHGLGAPDRDTIGPRSYTKPGVAMTRTEPFRVAAVQAAPVFLDATATTEKALQLVREAAAEGARLVAFGEGFLSAHPIWLHVLPITSSAQIELAGQLVTAAITIPGPETERLAEASRETGATVVIGVVERLSPRNSSLALSAVVATPDGRVAARRKLVPAVGERVLFTPGDGASIRTFETPIGPIGVLLGGENANPLLTWTLRELGARVHVALWPPHFNRPGVMAETATITGRAIAYQNTAWVVSVTGATAEPTRERIARTPEDRQLLDAMAADPGSAVYAPRGALTAGPLPGGEGILYADVDLDAGAWAALVNRQYDRPDLFRVTVRSSPRPDPLTLEDGSDSGSTEERARQLVDVRYGAELGIEDRERLVPYVSSVLDASARLEALDPTTFDPDTTRYVEGDAQ